MGYFLSLVMHFKCYYSQFHSTVAVFTCILVSFIKQYINYKNVEFVCSYGFVLPNADFSLLALKCVCLCLTLTLFLTHEN